MKHLNQLITLFLSFLAADEELMGLYLEDFTKKIVQPFVVVYVAGSIAADWTKQSINRIESFIEPETPDFYLTK